MDHGCYASRMTRRSPLGLSFRSKFSSFGSVNVSRNHWGELPSGSTMFRPAEGRQLVPVVCALIDIHGAVMERLPDPPAVARSRV